MKPLLFIPSPRCIPEVKAAVDKGELECKDHWDYSYQVHDVQ